MSVTVAKPTRKSDHSQPSAVIGQYTTKRRALHCYENNLLYNRTASQYEWEGLGGVDGLEEAEASSQRQHHNTQLVFSATHVFLSGTWISATLLASEMIRWTVNNANARLKAPRVRCIVRSVCT